jgi:hypothetical protein
MHVLRPMASAEQLMWLWHARWRRRADIFDLARDLDCVPMATRRRAIEHMPGVTGGPIPALYKALATMIRSQQHSHTPA